MTNPGEVRHLNVSMTEQQLRAFRREWEKVVRQQESAWDQSAWHIPIPSLDPPPHSAGGAGSTR